MMKNNKLGSLFWILLVVCILNIVGHLAVYPALPDTVPYFQSQFRQSRKIV